MLERLSVPRRTLDFEDYVDIFRRNVRWILAPTFLGLVAATVTAYLIQDTFVSQALVRIVPQQVPESLVATTNNQQLADHINAMAETIRSRNTLTSLIGTYGLYKRELRREPMEDVINQMRPAIKVQPTAGVTNVSGRNLPAIQLSFAYSDRYLAQKVCAEIVSRFMNENLRDRMDNVLATNQFLNDEFDHAKHDLDEIERKLTEFRIRNAGRLPEEMQMNVSQMNALEARLGGLNDAASRTNEQRMLLESDLRIAKDRSNAIKDVAPQVQLRNERALDMDRQIRALETNIASMKDRYTDDFPDLQQARSQLALMKRQREDLSKEKNTGVKGDPANENPLIQREKQDAQATIQQLQTQLEANRIQSQQINRDIALLNQSLKNYQGRIQSVPVGEKEYSDLMRDRDFAKAKYQEMELKRQRSAISMDMESRKQGETLEVLDQASLPESPTAPKRKLIIPSGAVIGLLFGVILVAVREVKDTSLKNLKDARLYTQLAILGSIPLLENDLVVQRRRQIMWVGWATAMVVGIAVMAGSVAHYYWSKV